MLVVVEVTEETKVLMVTVPVLVVVAALVVMAFVTDAIASIVAVVVVVVAVAVFAAVAVVVVAAAALVVVVAVVVVGLSARWNAQHPDHALRAGDRIVDVNGVTSDARGMIIECKVRERLASAAIPCDY